MDESIFKILGVEDREDSYTDLIAYAFNNSPKFKVNLLTQFEETNFEGWIADVRPAVKIKPSHGRNKDVPDLVLSSKIGNKIVLIEIKLHSNEGSKQTERYASDEFKNSLVEKLKIQNKLGNKTPEISFFYLTLEGDKPSSEKFTSIKYSKISKAISDISGNSKLDVLLKEFKERIDEYYNLPAPRDNENIADYLKRTNGFIKNSKTFRNFAENLLIDSGQFEKIFLETSNAANPSIPFCMWQKSSWTGEEYCTGADISKCHQIHFELQWEVNSNKLVFYLNYEIRPYHKQKEFKTLNSEVKNAHEEFKKSLHDYLINNNLEEWIIKTSYIRIAKMVFETDVTYGILKNNIRKLTPNMETLVDSWLKEHKIS